MEARKQPDIVIIGAGLQGLCVALGLAERGIKTVVLESRPGPIQAASYGNEGKIHLGLVYALDPTGRTGHEMLRGALSFSPLLDRWCDPLPWHEWKSDGFRYAVMPDSMADLPTLETHYEGLRNQLGEIATDLPVEADYFGRFPSWLWKRSATHTGSPVVDGKPVDCFDTEEISIDTRLFSLALLDKIKLKSAIELRCNHKVVSAQRCNDGFQLEIETPDGPVSLNTDMVINCAWTDRIRLDRTVGINKDTGALSYRVKHRVIVRPCSDIQDLVPVTMVQGPFGDMVPLEDGSVYLSWYPECRTYFEKNPPLQESGSQATLDAVSSRTVAVMSDLFPPLKNAHVMSCSPCTIVAEGTRDVDDPESELHRRINTGPHGNNGWWSVNTGKLTLAPLYGELTARLVLEELGLNAG